MTNEETKRIEQLLSDGYTPCDACGGVGYKYGKECGLCKGVGIISLKFIERLKKQCNEKNT